MIESISFLVLIMTAVVVGMQSFATREMAENQFMPAVEVYMIYAEEQKRTYFSFKNFSNTPALVSLKVLSGGKQLHGQNFRISPQCLMKTDEQYDFEPVDSKEVFLKVSIKPALKNFHVENGFEKCYKFNFSKKSWDETSWGYRDPNWKEIC